MTRPRLTVLASILVLSASLAVPQTSAVQRADEPAKLSLAKGLIAEADRLMARLKAGEHPKTLLTESDGLLDLCVAFASPGRDSAAIIRVASTNQLLAALADIKELPGGLGTLLADNPALSRELGLSISSKDKPERVIALLAHLAKERPELVSDNAKLSALVSAICVVYDEPPAHPALPKNPVPIQSPPGNGNSTNSRPLVMPAAPLVDPLVVLDHFAKLRRQSVFPLESMPVALLIHVVDVHTTPQDRTWAIANYAGNRTPGMLYNSITYDTAHFKYNQPKKIFREKAYSLENIKRVGGVCVEQAFFSSEVGKSIGVPSVYVSARGATIGHAYVGYLKPQGGTAVWDFDEGRYDEYEDLCGNVINPQTGERTDTGAISLTGLLAADKPEDRALSAALTIAARRVGALAGGQTEYPPAAPESFRHACTGKGRPAIAQSQVDLLRAALAAAPAHVPAWRSACQLAELGQLSSAQRGEWCKAAITMCARSAPDFAFSILESMIGTSSAEEQDRQWDWASKQFNTRPDLVAACRLNAGKAWELAENKAKAWAAYQDVIRRFPNDGTVIIEALHKSEEMLKDRSKQQAVIDLYEDAFRRIRKPSKLSNEFLTLTNYFRVGYRLAELLRGAGRANDAGRILDQIGATDSSQVPRR